MASTVVTFGCVSSTASRSTTPTISPTSSVSTSTTLNVNQVADEHFANNFRTAEAKAKDLGYTLYWLGPQFTVSDVVSKGPFVHDLRPDDVPGIVEVQYSRDGPLSTTTRDAELTLLEISPTEWQRVKDSAYTPGGTSVLVAGKQSQFYSLPDPNTKITTLRVVVDFGPTVLVAEATSLLSAGKVDLNLLTDEQTFLSVLQNLRPYPQ